MKGSESQLEQILKEKKDLEEKYYDLKRKSLKETTDMKKTIAVLEQKSELQQVQIKDGQERLGNT